MTFIWKFQKFHEGVLKKTKTGRWMTHWISFVQQMKDVINLFLADLDGLGWSGGGGAIGSFDQSLDLNLRVELDRPEKVNRIKDMVGIGKLHFF